ncbi:MAG: Cypemycin N-terminal methyltransferase [Planctomycetes bacterium]|nr:Cypemycin N-terminal methyltransferase [Planctomycetota bacterium]
MPDAPWFERAFGPEYLLLYAHRSPEEGAAQVQDLLRSGLLERRSPVLDLGCGAGRHLRAMRAAGLRALGLDLSRDLLAHGALGGVAVRGDMRRLPWRRGAFACVTSLFTSFGYFNDAENLAVLREVRRVLQPGGALLLDHINPGPTLAKLVPQSRETLGEAVVTSTRRHDAAGRRVIKEVEMAHGQSVQRWQESVRLYEPDELDRLLQSAGLEVERRCADFAGGPFDPSASPRQFVKSRAHGRRRG